jgi:hypothetical protein
MPGGRREVRNATLEFGCVGLVEFDLPFRQCKSGVALCWPLTLKVFTETLLQTFPRSLWKTLWRTRSEAIQVFDT